MRKLYLIGNAHLDPVWLWRWQEGFAEIIATFRSALDRLTEFPDLKFTSACAAYYEWIENIDPEMFLEIKERVKDGRWNIVGGWYIQPDCNTPCGESFARHSLISQRYFKRKFGVCATTGYNVDSFGHNANIPMILKNSGMDNYVFMRPGEEDDIKLETLFNWESADGSTVCAYRLPITYALKDKCDEWIPEYTKKAQDNDMDYMMFIGIGNHGGGPTIALLDEINKIGGPHFYSTTDEYFKAVNKGKLPVWKTELQHHAVGCYSAYTQVKKGNRKCEQNLLVAERLCTLAKYLTGMKYPQKEFERAWKILLFNQFHDILGGCSIKDAYEDTANGHGEVMHIAEQYINLAMQKICMSVDTLQGETLPCYKIQDWDTYKVWLHEVLGTPIVVFNPHTWAVSEAVELSSNALKVTDENNVEIPVQKTRTKFANNGDWYNSVFKAEIPPLGYRVYRYFVRKESETEFMNEMIASETLLENSKIRVEFDKKTGDICKFYNKENNEYIIDKPCSAVVLDETPYDTWAHRTLTLGEIAGTFNSPEFTILECGNVRSILRVKTYYENSWIQRDYTLTSGSNEVRVKVNLSFNELHKCLKFIFPIDGKKIVAQIPYGTVERQFNTEEESFGMWFASGKVCVANDCKHGYDTKDGFMRMTILRTTLFADHGFGEYRDEFCEHMDLGIHEFTYSIYPYKDNAEADRRANELNSSLRSVNASFHNGQLPQIKSCFKCDNDDIVVSAIKQNEDSEENIIRFFELNGKNSVVNIEMFGKKIETEITHNSIRTLSESGKKLNLIEWEI